MTQAVPSLVTSYGTGPILSLEIQIQWQQWMELSGASPLKCQPSFHLLHSMHPGTPQWPGFLWPAPSHLPALTELTSHWPFSACTVSHLFALLSFHQQRWKHEKQMELLIRLINVISLCPSPSSWEQACPLVIGYCCLLLLSKAHWILGFSSSPSEFTLRYIARIL